jgi:glycerol-3-phosphate cytidylyltransferase
MEVEEIDRFRSENRNLRIGVVASCFDLMHAGHVLMLKDARSRCDLLVAFLQTNPTVDRPHKNKPVLSFEERQILVEGCRWIDKVFVYTRESELYEGLRTLEADLRILGDDYCEARFTGDDLPTQVYFHDRSSHGWSTTKLRKRIYEMEKTKAELEATWEKVVG